MKRIFLPFGRDGAENAPLDLAIQLAGKFDGKVDAKFYPRPVDSPLVDPMGVGIIDYAEKGPDFAREADEAASVIENRLKGMGESASRVALSKEPLRARFGIGELARMYDVTLVAKSELGDWRAVFETALFEGGRQVMLVPESWSKPCGDNVAIAWNRSTESARLIAQSLDTLRQAARVVIIEVEGWFVSGPDGAELANYLAIHGVKAETVMQPRSLRGPGLDILERVEAEGIDLLIKGAYTQSRLRQMVFGGATSDIISDAQVPVVFAH